jgi:phosphoribosylaminoimidazolecarboxamide formyltransferase/IMP cyclohydrolase
MLFGWRVVKHVKSNAIVYANADQTLGIGAGQMSRVDSVEIAIEKAGDRVGGSILASDAFFPFPDCVEIAAEAGISAVLQPGGSIKDQDSINMANQKNISMVCTGVRHFKH